MGSLGNLDPPAIDVYVLRVSDISRILSDRPDRNLAIKENDLACKGAIAVVAPDTAPIVVIKATT